MFYPPNFDSDNRCFQSFKYLESKGAGYGPKKGLLPIDSNAPGGVYDIWQLIVDMVNDTGDSKTIDDFNNAIQFAVWADNSPSLKAQTTMKNSLDLLEQKIQQNAKITVNSTYNNNENFVLPFINEFCCDNQHQKDRAAWYAITKYDRTTRGTVRIDVDCEYEGWNCCDRWGVAKEHTPDYPVSPGEGSLYFTLFNNALGYSNTKGINYVQPIIGNDGKTLYISSLEFHAKTDLNPIQSNPSSLPSTIKTGDAFIRLWLYDDITNPANRGGWFLLDQTYANYYFVNGDLLTLDIKVSNQYLPSQVVNGVTNSPDFGSFVLKTTIDFKNFVDRTSATNVDPANYYLQKCHKFNESDPRTVTTNQPGLTYPYHPDNVQNLSIVFSGQSRIANFRVFQ